MMHPVLLEMQERLDRAGSPFPLLKVPPFSEFSRGDWTLSKKQDVLVARGYFSGPTRMEENWVLQNKDVTWMSTTPMELESQAHHALAAHGDVLIAGAGMGVLAYNCVVKPEVDSVTIVEKDLQVVKLLDHIATFNRWPRWGEDGRVNILHDDALTIKPAEDYDVVLVDIWHQLGSMAVRRDMQTIACNISAKAYAGWGMELDFITWCMDYRPRIDVARVRPHHWTRYGRDIGVPLIQPHENMSALAVQAGYQTILTPHIQGC